jgi:hypothetical protein
MAATRMEERRTLACIVVATVASSPQAAHRALGVVLQPGHSGVGRLTGSAVRSSFASGAVFLNRRSVTSPAAFPLHERACPPAQRRVAGVSVVMFVRNARFETGVTQGRASRPAEIGFRPIAYANRLTLLSPQRLSPCRSAALRWGPDIPCGVTRSRYYPHHIRTIACPPVPQHRPIPRLAVHVFHSAPTSYFMIPPNMLHHNTIRLLVIATPCRGSGRGRSAQRHRALRRTRFHGYCTIGSWNRLPITRRMRSRPTLLCESRTRSVAVPPGIIVPPTATG